MAGVLADLVIAARPGRRRAQQPAPAPEPCDCSARLAELEADLAAFARTIAALRPRAAHHTIEQGLTGWGVQPADAARIAQAARRT